MSSVAESHRLAILSQEEIDELYGLPRFTDDDRHTYFDLSPSERTAVEARTATIGAFLALELGYFKAKRQFFVFDPPDVAEDLRYLWSRYFPDKRTAAPRTLPSPPTRRLIQRTVLELLGYRVCDTAAQHALEEKTRRLALRSTRPVFLLREILQYLGHERLVAPSYSTLQDLVGRVVTYERNRVAGLLESTLTPPVANALDDWGLLRNQSELPTRNRKERRGEASLEIGARGPEGAFAPTGRQLTAPVRNLSATSLHEIRSGWGSIGVRASP